MNKKKLSAYVAGGFVVTMAVIMLIFISMILAEKIHPRQIRLIISTPNARRMYDGKPLYAHSYDLEYGELEEGHVIDIYYENEQIWVGQSKNSAIVYITDEKGNDVSDRYSIEYKFGTLEVLPCQITILTETIEKYYDGKPLKGKSYKIIGGSLAADHNLVSEMTGEQTRVGETDNSMEATVLNAEGKPVTNQFNISYIFGKLKVHPRRIELMSGSTEKIYDGKPLTNSECSLSSGSIVSGQTLDASAVGKQSGAGQSPNIINAHIYDKNGEDVTDQYDITYRTGTLTVTPRKISIMSKDGYKIYDGTPLKEPGWGIIAGELCSGHTIQVVTSSSQTEVGECDNQISYVVIYDKTGDTQKDVTYCYQIECYYGILTVDPSVS